VHGLDGRLQRRVGLEREARHEAGGAQHAQRVVPEGDLGVERRAQATRGQIAQPVEGVDQLHVGQAQRQRVDGEVPPRQVQLDVVAERHLGLARVGHVDLGPVGGDLEDLPVAPAAPMVPKRAPWVHTSSAQPRTRSLDLVGPGVGGEVEVRIGAVRPPWGRGRRAPSRPPDTGCDQPW
jgi:hypothetical protein